VWRVYKFDIHGGRSAQYPAICQRAGVVTVTRDGGKVDTGMFGINIHKGGYKGTSSEGCQTIHPDQWQRFYSTMERLAKSIHGDKYKSQVYAYVLINN
jgi:lysozyme